jgi:dienelactone hydrolase
MNRLLTLTAAALTLAALPLSTPAQDKDARYGKPKDYNGYFPWTPPTNRAAWEKRRQEVREQVLVANGLWPMPEKTPLRPVIHGKIERDGYTIEKVYFASLPGHYVTGNLYRPTGKSGKLPAVLCPHGHWNNGRLYEANDKEVEKQMAGGAEKTKEGARYPLQARCAQLARMGCVVFFYDMIGYADSQQIKHRDGFLDAEAELRLQNFMGLQTWNTIRAYDFLSRLQDVDPARIGVTGASGGGTQTFILGAIDDRPAAAFPAVMVSTAMQGGCICENASYLRVGTGNIELAGLFAPRPLGMSGANDWTVEIETKGLPELKALYRLYGVEDNVFAKTYKQFGHNYNQPSRELMYNFFNKHLKLGFKEPVTEQPFVPVPPKELSVFDKDHPLPKDATNATGVRRYLTKVSDDQLEALVPTDRVRLASCRDVTRTALRVMIGDKLPEPGEVTKVEGPAAAGKTLFLAHLQLQRKGTGASIPALYANSQGYDGTVVIWVDPAGLAGVAKGAQLSPEAAAVLKNKAAILAIEPFRTGEKGKEAAPPVNKAFAGYTFGYNRPLVSERVADILTAVAYAKSQPGVKKIHLVGVGKAGPWVLLARGLCGDAVQRTAVDLNGFRFEQVKDLNDEMMLPGALKYGGLPALAALCAPGELYLHNAKDTGPAQWLQAAYNTAGVPNAWQHHDAKKDAGDVVQWLLR